MYQRIIVPVDGSELSEEALVTAKKLAKESHATLVLVRAASASVFPGADPTQAQVNVVQEAEAYLENLAAGLLEEHIAVETAVPYMAPAEGILLEAENHHADCIVMCSHGRSGLGRWVHGSIAEQIMAHSRVPVILVKPGEPQSSLQFGSAESPLLVPLDGSIDAEAAIPSAWMLAQTLHRKIVLLRVIGPQAIAANFATVGWGDPFGAEKSVTQSQRITARRYLFQVPAKYGLDVDRVRSLVKVGDPVPAIREASQAVNAAAIVMATHGSTGLENLIAGSVALEEVRLGSLPVCLVRTTGIDHSAVRSGEKPPESMAV